MIAYVTRVTRSGMLTALGEDYVRTARAKGVPARLVVWRHALRNVLIPVVTIIGLNLGVLIGNWLSGLIGVRDTGGIDWIRHILQVVTAVVLLGILGGVMGRKSSV